MPTARGWTTIAAGVILLATGRALGTGALEQLGFALVALVALAIVVVRSRRHELAVHRSIIPERARAGQGVKVKLRVTNVGRGVAPLMLLDDRLPIELTGHARFAITGIEPGGDRDTGYELRPPRRGRYEIGPLNISFVDPFGLAQRKSEAAGSMGLLVHPRVERLAMPRDLGLHRSMAVSALTQITSSRGEDFYTMREYSEGDDMRRIHWPSTAKLGKPMVRQEETPWHTRATILIDDSRHNGAGFGDEPAFERCVEAAASVASLYNDSGYSFRLATVHRPGVPSARGSGHLHRCLDLLAVLEPSGPEGHDAAVLRLAELETGSTAEGTLVVVSTALSAEAALRLTRCQRRFKQVFFLAFPVHRFGSSDTRQRWEGEQSIHETAQMLARSQVNTLVVSPGESLSAAWGALGSQAAMSAGGDARWAQKPAPA